MVLNNMLILLIVHLQIISSVFGEEIVCNINGKKSLHVVSDRFLSLSIDPAVLLTGHNISLTSLHMAQNLSPAFIRIAGRSTNYIEFSDDREISNSIRDHASKLIVTSSMLISLHEWMTKANVTPIFALNDNQRINGSWNPKLMLPLFEFSDKLNMSCFWQLGYDCSSKTEMRYKEDLVTLRHVLDAFPESKGHWKIAGSDFSRCIPSANVENIRRIIEDLEGTADVVMWESRPKREKDFPEKKLVYAVKPRVPVWALVPKARRPISFSSAILWAMQIGQAAKSGYEVVFRQPRLHELFSDTPVYWVSLLHKALMGRNVLEAKSTSSNSKAYVYAQCSKGQNSFTRRGAMTVFIVNNGTSEHTASIRVAGAAMKNIEVQSYILTAPREESTDVYLNGEKLSMDIFEDERMLFIPKLRRARPSNYLNLSLPPKSIGFFVLPGARVPVCINEEEEIKLLMEEICEDQNIRFSEEQSLEMSTEPANQPSLNELYHLMEQELEEDEKYYKKISSRRPPNTSEWEKMVLDKAQEEKRKKFEMQSSSRANEARQLLMQRAKAAEKQKKSIKSDHNRQLKQLLLKKSKENKKDMNQSEGLDLSSSEVLKIFADRAKAHAAEKKTYITSEEIVQIMSRATEKLAGRKQKRYVLSNDSGNWKLQQLRNQPNRIKRGINMELLKLKAEPNSYKAKHSDKQQVEATIRQLGQTSAEILSKLEISEEAPFAREIFAELADTDNMAVVNEKPSKSKVQNVKFQRERGKLFFNSKILDNTFTSKPSVKPSTPKSLIKDDSLEHTFRILTAEDGFDSEIEEDLKNYHEFHENFGDDFKIRNNIVTPGKIWEFGEFPEVVPGNKDAIDALMSADTPGVNSNVDRTPGKIIGKEYSNIGRVKPEESGSELSFEMNDYFGLDSDEKKNPMRFKREPETLQQQKIKQASSIMRMRTEKARNINERKRLHQMQMLQNRLVHRKNLEERWPKISKNENELSKKLSETNKVQNRRYIPQTAELNKWKPEDILKLRQNPAPSSDINRNYYVRKIPITVKRSYFENVVNRRSKRQTDEDASSRENDLDTLVNEIQKEYGVIAPFIDTNSGEYELVLPNRDAVTVLENKADTEIKLSHHHTTPNYDGLTCPLSTESITTEIPKWDILGFPNSYEGYASKYRYNEYLENYTISAPKESQNYTLNISLDNENDSADLVHRMVNTFNHMIENVREKVVEYMKYING